MSTDIFMQGLFVAMDEYADKCGLDGYALATGGRKYGDESYKHVRRKQDFVRRVEQLLRDFEVSRALCQESVSLSTPVEVPEDYSDQMRREQFDNILRSIKWDVVKHWWKREDFGSDMVWGQYIAMGKLHDLDRVEYERVLTAHTLTRDDIEPPSGYLSVLRWGDEYDEFAKRYGLTQFTTEEKADIIRRYEKSIAQTRAAHAAYFNRDESLNENWLKRITNWIKS